MGHMALSWSENKACHGLSCFIIRIIIIFTFLQNCHFGDHAQFLDKARLSGDRTRK